MAKDTSPSFQPYQQIAEVFTKSGFSSQANDVLFAGRELERSRAKGWHYWELTVASYLIGYGYGYRYFYSLGWAALLVFIGWFLLRMTDENKLRNDGKHLGLLYCIDMLLPVIQFKRAHYELEPSTPAGRTYFIFQRIAGYILGAFILAGLSGITK